MQQPSQVPDPVGTKRNLPGGVVTEVIQAAPPGARVARMGVEVRLNYVGSLPKKENRRFDRGDIDFILGDGSMIRGFDAGVVGMGVGEKRKLFIPSNMGYGKKGKKPKVPPDSDLIFDMVLVQAGIKWGGDDKKKSAMSQERREKAKRRGKKSKST